MNALLAAYEASALGAAARGTVWVYAPANLLHVLGACLLLGAVAVFDIAVLRAHQAALAIGRVALPIAAAGLAVQLATGLVLFAAEATTMAYNPAFIAKIIALDLSKIGGEVTCQKDSFLCAAYGTQVTIAFNKKLGAGFFGGEGFILQKLRGDGKAFVHASGTIIERELKGETLRVDTGCLVAFSPGIEYSIERAGNLKSMFFGGEGLFLATLRGHGHVWLQSLPFSRLADRVIQAAPSIGGTQQGEGSVLGGLGRLLDGN